MLAAMTELAGAQYVNSKGRWYNCLAFPIDQAAQRNRQPFQEYGANWQQLRIQLKSEANRHFRWRER